MAQHRDSLLSESLRGGSGRCQDTGDPGYTDRGRRTETPQRWTLGGPESDTTVPPRRCRSGPLKESRVSVDPKVLSDFIRTDSHSSFHSLNVGRPSHPQGRTRGGTVPYLHTPDGVRDFVAEEVGVVTPLKRSNPHTFTSTEEGRDVRVFPTPTTGPRHPSRLHSHDRSPDVDPRTGTPTHTTHTLLSHDTVLTARVLDSSLEVLGNRGKEGEGGDWSGTCLCPPLFFLSFRDTPNPTVPHRLCFDPVRQDPDPRSGVSSPQSHHSPMRPVTHVTITGGGRVRVRGDSLSSPLDLLPTSLSFFRNDF